MRKKIFDRKTRINEQLKKWAMNIREVIKAKADLEERKRMFMVSLNNMRSTVMEIHNKIEVGNIWEGLMHV
jgi:hypothetical protein